MLKNIPHGWVSFEENRLFYPAVFIYVVKEDGKDESSIVFSREYGKDIVVKAEPSAIFDKINGACGRVLDIVKVHSNWPKASGRTPATYYLHRNLMSQIFPSSVTVGETKYDAVGISFEIVNDDVLIYHDLQKFIDLMSATPYC